MMKHIAVLAAMLRTLGQHLSEFFRGIVEAITGKFRGGPGDRPWFGASGVPRLPRTPRRGASAANPLPTREAEPQDLVGTRQ